MLEALAGICRLVFELMHSGYTSDLVSSMDLPVPTAYGKPTPPIDPNLRTKLHTNRPYF